MSEQKPLTLEEMQQMVGKSVWIECLKPNKYICPPAGWRVLSKSISGRFGVWNGESCLVERDYGTDWIAYAADPTRLDRSAWTAEWIWPSNEFNLPKCSKCGCNSKDATYGHKNNFCPKCGRAMNSAAWEMLEKRLEGRK